MNLAMDLNALDSCTRTSSQSSTGSASVSGSNFSQALAQASAGGETGYDGYFEAAAAAYQLPVSLLKAVGKAESGYNPNAVSPCGAQGIMQLMPATARALGVGNSFDPAQNIMGGAKFLRQMLDRFDGDVTLALAAYNAGPGAVSKYGGVPPYSETQNYVAKVLGYMGGDLASYSSAAPLIQSAAGTASASGDSSLALTSEDWSGLVQNILQSGDTTNKESLRLLLNLLLTKDFERIEEEEENASYAVL